ncbi:ATPase [Campylobacter jejuni]|nr:ATPase [Campylobacter jejuni]
MNHLLILYNPYYQEDVIKQHLSILQEKSQVAFGKIKSKLNDQEKQNSLEEIYQSTNCKGYFKKNM